MNNDLSYYLGGEEADGTPRKRIEGKDSRKTRGRRR
jgi:hypothetical protein